MIIYQGLSRLTHPFHTFEPTRQAGLTRLATFAPISGSAYAATRNFDYGSAQATGVSMLSPWIKHRLIREDEVIKHVIAQHGTQAASKFIQEISWRGYFKGWLEQHPSVWTSYLHTRDAAFANMELDLALSADYTAAKKANTGIACFDHWIRELIETGYLHNHARMWFASIWIFTLRLPWALGADFFLKHLIDGDAASNTLSWRWVAGLHTKGKTYLATPENIVTFTDGRFNPVGQLANHAAPLVENTEHPLVPLTMHAPNIPNDALRIITSEDCGPQVINENTLALPLTPEAPPSALVSSFKQGALQDAASRAGGRVTHGTASEWAEIILKTAQTRSLKHVVTPYAAIGDVASALQTAKATLADEGITLHLTPNTYDSVVWPHACKGFFKLKKKIPDILDTLPLS